MSDQIDNPYAAPQAPGLAAAFPTEVEATRRKYLSHEASVKSIGTLYILGAIFMVPFSLLMLASSISRALSAADGGAAGAAAAGIAFSVFYFGIGILQGATAIGLRSLKTWARVVAIILSAIGLLAVPIGTLISAYFLYLLVSEKGRVVFSDEYKQVIEQTPHIRYKTSLVVIVLLLVLLALLVVAVIVPIVTLRARGAERDARVVSSLPAASAAGLPRGCGAA